jgi:23S rRNA (uracil1939-C5)-methyltransferase
VILTTSGEDLPGAEALGEALRQAFPEIKSVVHSINRRKAQVAIGDEEIVISGAPTVQERLGNFVFEISPSSFFQPNTLQAEQLYRRVVELIDPRPEDRALDVYCGTGGISLFLSERVGQVVGVEVAESAVQDAVRNSANNGVDNCRFISGSAEQILHQLKVQGERFDVAVTDPPRPGMHLKALQALAELRPNRIVYVSCNPQVLGVDLKRLEAAGYRADYLQLVDMLPHTPHCEVLARLVYMG